MFNLIGTLRYSPKSRGDKDSKWWAILDCDPGVGGLYRRLFDMTFFDGSRPPEWVGKKLVRPAWQEHVTVVRDEEPPEDRKALWGLDAGKEFVLESDGIIRGTDLFVWIDVRCEALLDLREKLGLPRRPLYDFHLTVGNTKNQ